MIFNIKTIILDWRLITAHIQKQVIKDKFRENKGWIDHQYSVGDKVYLQLTVIRHKFLEMHKKGLYRRIMHVFTNGTVCLQIGATNDKVNIFKELNQLLKNNSMYNSNLS
jgi:hypothetical protein